jgi:hypothetical protein
MTDGLKNQKKLEEVLWPDQGTIVAISKEEIRKAVKSWCPKQT